MRIGKYVFKDKTGKHEIDPTKAQLGTYIDHLQKENERLENQLKDMSNEQITEMKEHQGTMKLADTTIKNLEKENVILKKALELACDTHQFEDTCNYCSHNEERFKTNGCPCSCEDEPYFNRDCAINYFIQQAQKELGDKE